MLQTQCYTQCFKLFMKDEKKLRISPDERHDLFSLLEELERLQEKYQGCLWEVLESSVPSHVSDNVELLQFQELRKSSIVRSTDGGILADDRQRFFRFKTAMGIVTKSTQGKEQQLSSQLESLLSTITSLITKVLQENRISLPPPAGLSDLRERLDTNTRQFLDVFGESGNNADGTYDDSELRDVRNYVIVKDLGDTLLLFKRDLVHLMGGI